MGLKFVEKNNVEIWKELSAVGILPFSRDIGTGTLSWITEAHHAASRQIRSARSTSDDPGRSYNTPSLTWKKEAG